MPQQSGVLGTVPVYAPRCLPHEKGKLVLFLPTSAVARKEPRRPTKVVVFEEERATRVRHQAAMSSLAAYCLVASTRAGWSSARERNSTPVLAPVAPRISNKCPASSIKAGMKKQNSPPLLDAQHKRKTDEEENTKNGRMEHDHVFPRHHLRL